MSDAHDATYSARTGRYVLGGVTEVSSWALEWWDRVPPKLDPSDLVYFVEKKFEGQPYKLGMLFYGDEELWWVVCQYNGILDPVAELVEGRRLLIPLEPRVRRELFVAQQRLGGVPSTRSR